MTTPGKTTLLLSLLLFLGFVQADCQNDLGHIPEEHEYDVYADNSQPADKQSAFYCEEQKYNFGTQLVGVPCIHQFEFTNTGTDTLVIYKVSVSPLGSRLSSDALISILNTKATTDKTHYAPGEGGILTLIVDSSRSGFLSCFITVKTNSQITRQSTLTTAGTFIERIFEYPSQSRLLFKETEHDFGDIIQMNKCQWEFTYQNEGPDTLVIHSVKSSGGGAIAYANGARTVPPGGQGTIPVTYNTARIGLFRRTITLRTDSERMPEMRLLIRGNVLPLNQEEPAKEEKD